MQQRGAPVEARPLSGSSAMARVERLIFETSRPGLYPQRQACTRKREQAQCHFQIGRAERPRVELAQRVISTHCLCPSPPVVTSSGVDGEDVLPLTSPHRRTRAWLRRASTSTYFAFAISSEGRSDGGALYRRAQRARAKAVHRDTTHLDRSLLTRAGTRPARTSPQVIQLLTGLTEDRLRPIGGISFRGGAAARRSGRCGSCRSPPKRL
jgi:hypothetical protein